MPSTLCPIVLGREEELDRLDELLAVAGHGRGRLIVLRGEAGIGKTRLAHELEKRAKASGMAVLVGRGAPGSAALPFRPLVEALRPVARSLAGRDIPELDGYWRHLAPILPRLGIRDGELDRGAAPQSLLGESVARLLRAVGGRAGCVLVMEDLHWADPETVAVVEYLADVIAEEPLLVVATARPERGGAVSELIHRRRADAVVLDLQPLPQSIGREVVAACLGTADPPPVLVDLVLSHSDGLPLLVEELLAGLQALGALTRGEDGSWNFHLPTQLPLTGVLADSVFQRLARLSPSARRALSAAALLGRRFDWQILPGVAGLEAATVVESLRDAVGAQLLAVDGDSFRFRHALTRDAVLAEILPPERTELAERALTAVERAHPGLPGAWCDLAADLACAGTNRVKATALVTECARRALHDGALASAELLAHRAAEMAPADSEQSSEAEEILVTALAQAGQVTAALERGRPLLDRLRSTAPAHTRVDLAIVLTRATLAGGDTDAAAALLEQARSFAPGADAALRAKLDAAGAHVELARGRLPTARRLAQAALVGARTEDMPEVECEALEALGRLTEARPERASLFEQAAEVAQRHSLTNWRLRAMQELALPDVARGRLDRLEELRRVAAQSGAWVTVAQLDLVRADIALASFDGRVCEQAAVRCIAASRRYGLASLPVALLWLAGSHALAGRVTLMEEVLAQADGLAPGDRRIGADSWGRVRAWYFAVREDLPGLRDALARSMELTRGAPLTSSMYLGQVYWAMLRTMCDQDLGSAARAEVSTSLIVHTPFGQPARTMIEAVALGRQGRAEDAATMAETASRRFSELGPAANGHYLVRWGAEAAVRDGWAYPTEALLEAEAHFTEMGHHRIARQCRALLKATGARAPRRSRGAEPVPPPLRRLGITSRELEVLRLVAQGHPTREIAARLVLSPRTVEHHVASLHARTGLHTRAELAGWARQRGYPGPTS